MHTPGPWSVVTLGDRYAAYELQPASTRAHNRALGKDRSGAGCRAEIKANAKLIAAAPELLEALKKVERAASESSSTLEFSIMCDQIMEEIRAAIAKATA